MSSLVRETRETTIRASVRRGSGDARVQTDDRFLSHMVETLARYAALDIDLEASGDLRHHLVEDVGITLGLALRDEIPEQAERYGAALVPMDDALVQAAVDVGGRPWYEGPLPSKLYAHFLQSFSVNLAATVHVRVIRGQDKHHVVEAAVKAVGLSLRSALSEGDVVFSTKGSVRLERGPTETA